jgi:hypothetical protein
MCEEDGCCSYGQKCAMEDRDERTMRESSKAQRKLQHVLLGYTVRVFVNGLDGHRIEGTRPHAVDLRKYVSKMHQATVAKAHRRYVGQSRSEALEKSVANRMFLSDTAVLIFSSNSFTAHLHVTWQE